jgi:hypothetical protein
LTITLQEIPAPPVTTPLQGETASGFSFGWVQWFQQLTTSIQSALANIAAQAIVGVTQADLPVTLTEDDAGAIFFVTDFGHLLEWNGAEFVWGPGDTGSGYIAGFESAPTAAGWHLCDGSAVERLNQDGTVSSVVLPNYTTAAYLKLGNALSIGPNIPSGLTQAASAGTPAGTNAAATSGVESADRDVQSGAGATVAASNHTHNVPGQAFTGSPLGPHQHGPGTMDLENTVLLAYFRQ